METRRSVMVRPNLSFNRTAGNRTAGSGFTAKVSGAPRSGFSTAAGLCLQDMVKDLHVHFKLGWMHAFASVQPARPGTARSAPGTRVISSTIRAFFRLCAAFPLRKLHLTAPGRDRVGGRKSSKP